MFMLYDFVHLYMILFLSSVSCEALWADLYV